ncbi:MAG TPA: HigA family addiction module antitoxin [Candidatus Krumholzibacteria bacterium]|nr:HigA family addiction module antitoxin [Candidatus Krumholzibacteria bacterium]
MIPKHRIPAHPGEILMHEYLRPMRITQVQFAAHIGVPVQRINEIVRGKRGITPDSAWLFAQALATTPEFWLNLQANHDLARFRPKRRIRSLVKAS